MDKKKFIVKLPNKKDFIKMRDRGVFVFDSCSLLSIYSFSDDERKEFLSILKDLAKKKRLWLPYQFLEEFEVHRLEKIEEQYENYTKIKNILDRFFDGSFKDLSANISGIGNQKPLKIFKKKLIEDKNKFHKQVVRDLNKVKEKHPDWRVSDSVKKRLMQCFKGKIGDPYDDERYQEIISEGQKRYNRSIPPGYKDSEKNRRDISEKKQFGDLIAWFQIMDYAKTYKKPIVIVTDDEKEDWWNKQNGKLFGPRIELMHEIYNYAGVHLEMFNMEKFLKFVKEEFKFTVQDTLLEKVKKVEGEESISNMPIASGEPELGSGNKIDIGTPKKT